MSKSDKKYINKSEDHELNNLLKKWGKSQSKDNRKILIKNIPNNSTHIEVEEMYKEGKFGELV